jgi:HTH-type transcriptional regulator/antitoxin HigA
MEIKPIRNEKDLKLALARVDKIIDSKRGTAEGDELEILSVIIEAYENRRHPIDPPDPIEAIKFRMEQQGSSRAELAEILGGKNRVSEVLSRKRPLTLRMIRRLHETMNIPFESLIGFPAGSV